MTDKGKGKRKKVGKSEKKQSGRGGKKRGKKKRGKKKSKKDNVVGAASTYKGVCARSTRINQVVYLPYSCIHLYNAIKARIIG